MDNLVFSYEPANHRTYWKLVGEEVTPIHGRDTKNERIIQERPTFPPYVPFGCAPAFGYYVLGEDVFETQTEALCKLRDRHYEHVEDTMHKIREVSARIRELG